MFSLINSEDTPYPILNFVSTHRDKPLVSLDRINSLTRISLVVSQDAAHPILNFVSTHPILNFVSALPKELKEEIVRYCEPFSFVLFKTDLFPVPYYLFTCSSVKFSTWAHSEEWS